MDLWTLHRYREPRLCVDAIELDPAVPAVTLRQGDKRYDLAFDDAAAAAQVAEDLASLCNSAAPLWETIRAAGADGWGALGAFLDSRALIREGRNADEADLRARAEQVESCISDIVAETLNRLPGERHDRLAGYAAQVRRDIAEMLAHDLHGSGRDPFDAAVQPNFFLGMLIAEFAYFKRSSPLTLLAGDAMLARFAGEQEAALAASDALIEALALYSLRDLESHLWLVASALAESTGQHALRFPTPPIPDLPMLSGLEFMRQVEVLTRTALGRWGENPYVTALDALGERYAPLIAGPFIEQYHVTYRFVEIIAPLLSRRLIAPLRDMMFRYYSEEVGHEALESTTCQTLGVTQSALDQAVPLPLHFAFVDLLTLIAQIDPIASCASIMVIEGVFGEPPKMSLRLAAVARSNPAFSHLAGDHDELNEDLNHNSISRDAFEHIAVIPVATQRRVIPRILFLLELNHRAWEGIAAYYGKQEMLHLQGSRGRPLSPAGTLMA